MGILSNKISKDDLKPGDHIYSWRDAYIYAHHGIYVGDNMVIHFTQGAGQQKGSGTFLGSFSSSSPQTGSGTFLGSFSSSSPQTGSGTFLGSFSSCSPSTTAIPCLVCGDQSNLKGVIKSCLDCFLSGCDLFLFHYSVSRFFFLAQVRGGTCTLASSDPPDVVLHRANYLLNNGFGTYHFVKNNCEDFAVYCETGLITTGQGGNDVPRSGQLTSLTAAATTFFLPTLVRCAMAVNPVVLSATAYCAGRYVYDVGVRSDAVKVDVEDLAAYMGGSINRW